jgi:hypothetical protein
VHVAVRPDVLAGHHAVLAERHQNPPFRYADPVAPRIDSRQRLRHQVRYDIELVGQELFEFEWRVGGGVWRRAGLLGSAVYRLLAGHAARMAELMGSRNGLRALSHRF